jgi:nitrogen PTS system EIIA component
MTPSSKRLKEDMLSISNYLTKGQVVFLETNTRNEIISELVENLYKEGNLLDKEAFNQAILEREKIVSTGIGMGVAIPHAKLPEYDRFFITLGIHRKGIDWHSLDGSPVHLVFMIGGADNQQTEYLQLLSRLTSAIKEESLRKALVKEYSKEAIIQLFKEY